MIAFATTLRSTCLSPVAVPFFPSPPTGPWEKLPVFWGLSARPESGVVFSMLPHVSSNFCLRGSRKGRAKPITRVAQILTRGSRKDQNNLTKKITRGSRKLLHEGRAKSLLKGRANPYTRVAQTLQQTLPEGSVCLPAGGTEIGSRSGPQQIGRCTVVDSF